MSGRTAHVLRGPKSCKLPRRIITLAVRHMTPDGMECADKIVHRLRCVAAVSYRVQDGRMIETARHLGYSGYELWRWVASEMSDRHDTYLVGHNVGYILTLTEFWHQLESGHYQLVSDDWRLRGLKGGAAKDRRRGVLCIEDPPTIIHCWHAESRRKLVVLDLLNYFRDHLSELALDCPSTLALDVPFWMQDASSLTQCLVDAGTVASALMALMRLLADYRFGGLKPTAAGCAYAGFLRSYQQHPIYCHADDDALRLERAACFGGMCHTFRHGYVSGPVVHLDVNSMYPHVMASHWFPSRLVDHIDRPDPGSLCASLTDHCAVAVCHVVTERHPYPVRTEGGPCMAVGDYWTVLTTPDMLFAHEHGELVEVRDCYMYEALPLFAKWVSSIYHARMSYRERQNSCMERACSLMLKSLSGKFGQRAVVWEDTDREPARQPWGWWLHQHQGERLPSYYRAVNRRVQTRGVPGEGRESCPSIYAHVTAYARRYLWRLIEMAGVSDVHYTDTDSLHVTDDGYHRLFFADLVDDNMMGKLKIVEEAESAYYYGAKDYVIGERHVCGSVSRWVGPHSSRRVIQWVQPHIGAVLSRQPRDEIVLRLQIRSLSPCHHTGKLDDNGRVSFGNVTLGLDEFRSIHDLLGTRQHQLRATRDDPDLWDASGGEAHQPDG